MTGCRMPAGLILVAFLGLGLVAGCASGNGGGGTGGGEDQVCIQLDGSCDDASPCCTGLACVDSLCVFQGGEEAGESQGDGEGPGQASGADGEDNPDADAGAEPELDTGDPPGASTEAPPDDQSEETPGPSDDALADFSVVDVNQASPRYEEAVSPRDYLGQVSAWYFGHST